MGSLWAYLVLPAGARREFSRVRRQRTGQCLGLVAWIDAHCHALRAGDNAGTSAMLAWDHVVLADGLVVWSRTGTK